MAIMIVVSNEYNLQNELMDISTPKLANQKDNNLLDVTIPSHVEEPIPTDIVEVKTFSVLKQASMDTETVARCNGIIVANYTDTKKGPSKRKTVHRSKLK